MRADQTGVSGCVLRLFAQNGRKGLCRIHDFARIEHFFGCRNSLGQTAVFLWAHGRDTFNKRGHFGGCDRALKSINRLPLKESINRRDRLNAQLRGNLLVLVHIDLGHTYLAARCGHGGL